MKAYGLGVLVACCLVVAAVPASAQSQDTSRFDIKQYSFLLPQPLPAWKYSHSISLQYVVPPKDWTLDAVVAPMFNYTGKYTLPKGFNVQAGLSTLIISNRLNAGPFWNFTKENIHFGAGFQVAYNLGFLYSFGFNTVLTGWETQPSLTVGYSFEKTSLVLRWDMYNTLDISLNEAGNTISSNDRFVNGYSYALSYEQRLTKKRVMFFAFKLYNLRYHIIAWPALPASKYRYFMPEFQIGLNF